MRWSLGPVLAALTMTLSAHAQSMERPKECTTTPGRTWRPTNIVTNKGAFPAIEVRAGERLCLNAKQRNGRVTDFHLAPRGTHLAPSLRILFETERGSRLVVAHSLPGMLHYRVARAVGKNGELWDHGTGQAVPDFPEEQSWPEPFERIFLFDFRLQELVPALTPPVPFESFVSVLFVAAAHLNHQDALNDEFDRNGYGAVSPLQPMLGFGFDGAVGRVRLSFDAELGLPRSGDEAPDVTQVIVGLHGGCSIFDRGGLALAPMLGIAGGDLGTEVDPDEPALFASHAEDLEKRQRLRRNVGLLLFSLNVDYRRPFGNDWGLLGVLRAGYVHQFWQGPWVQEDPDLSDLRGGPDIDVSGPYLRLAAGVYAY